MIQVPEDQVGDQQLDVIIEGFCGNDLTVTRSFRTGILNDLLLNMSDITYHQLHGRTYEVCVYVLLFLPDNDICSVNAINGGQETVSINNSVAILDFEGTGPTSTNTVTEFTCRLDRTVNGNFVEVAGSEELCVALPGRLLKLATGLQFFNHVSVMFSCPGTSRVKYRVTVPGEGDYSIFVVPLLAAGCSDVKYQRFPFSFP